MAISHCYWHLLVKNDNFTLLPMSSGQEWQLADSRSGRSTPQMHHRIYIIGHIWQPFCILQEKVGISFYFLIIRVVNSQLALYSHVRCNPLDNPKPPPHDNYKFTNVYEGSYLPGVICNIVTPKMHHGIYIMDMYLAAILDSSRKGWNFLLFLNN